MPTIQQILQDHFDDLAASGTLSAPQQRAGWALRKCRSAALGGHVQRCPNGHVERVWYNSCRNRACPQCNSLARERWLQRTQAPGTRRADPARSRPTVTHARDVLESPVRPPQACRARARTRLSWRKRL